MNPRSDVQRSAAGRSTTLRAYVGCYESAQGAGDGGIRAFDVAPDGSLITINRVAEPGMADFLAYADSTSTLYAVDQRKSDGRGPVGPPSTVWSYRIDQRDGSLSFLNRQLAPGASGNYLCLTHDQTILLSAHHGRFDHVEQVRRTPGGQWVSEYAYDDSTVIAFGLEPGGELSAIRDLHLRSGHGPDPNSSPQAGGHAQASPHAHCVEVDPSGRWAVVCDKGTDEIVVLDLTPGLPTVSSFRLPPGSGPRHIAFDRAGDRAYLICELSSEVASLTFDAATGTFTLLNKASSVLPGQARLNEPASIRVHPNGRLLYLNNRGEDSLCWFSVATDGRLTRQGAVPLAPSEHPGVAARSFSFDPTGPLVFVSDLPANLVRAFAVDPVTGALASLSTTAVPRPAYIQLVG